MAILSSYIFWIIVGAIIIVLALIGYLAEGTEFANKALKKKKSDVTTPVVSEEVLVKSDLPVEVLKVPETPSAWTDASMQKDEKMEVVHKETSIDDWVNIPNVNEIPKISKEEIEGAMKNTSDEASKDDSDEASKDASTQSLDDNSADSSNSESTPEATDDSLEGQTNESNQDLSSQEMFPEITPADLEPEITPIVETEENNNDSVWK